MRTLRVALPPVKLVLRPRRTKTRNSVDSVLMLQKVVDEKGSWHLMQAGRPSPRSTQICLQDIWRGKLLCRFLKTRP